MPRDVFGVVPVLQLGILMRHLPTRVADALGDERWKDFIRQKAASYGPPVGEQGGVR